MTWVATDNFDSYTTGNNLNGGAGGSGWTGNWTQASGTITTDAAPAGGQGGNAAHGTTSSGYSRTFSGISAGVMSIRLLTTDISRNNDVGFNLKTGASLITYVILATDGNWKYYDGTTYQTLAAAVANTWVTIDVEFDDSAQPDKFRYRIDGGSWTAYAAANGTYTTLDGIRLFVDASDAGDFYWDDIKDGATPPPPASEGGARSLSLLGVGQ